jgi:hypothetical protein
MELLYVHHFQGFTAWLRGTSGLGWMAMNVINVHCNDTIA